MFVHIFPIAPFQLPDSREREATLKLAEGWGREGSDANHDANHDANRDANCAALVKMAATTLNLSLRPWWW